MTGFSKFATVIDLRQSYEIFIANLVNWQFTDRFPYYLFPAKTFNSTQYYSGRTYGSEK